MRTFGDSTRPEHIPAVMGLVILATLLLIAPTTLAEPVPSTPRSPQVLFVLQGEVREVITDPFGPNEMDVGGKVVTCPVSQRCPPNLLGAIVKVSGEAIRTTAGWVRVADVVSVLG